MSDTLTSPPPPAAAPKLDDLMLAMDVVDTLRHDQRLVERELSLGYSDEALIERLREIYKGQGIEVSDRVLEEGVKALREQRFTYNAPKPSLSRGLALAWIDRGRIGKIAAGALLALVAAGLLYYLAVTRPREVAELKAREEIGQILPTALETNSGDVLREAKVEAAKTYAAQLLSDGKAALARGDAEGARKANADMTALLNDLRTEFTLRIVNRPGEASGVWRKPTINAQARNDYLIVEAIAANGRALPRPILNDETGVTSTVEKWGIRVSSETFQKVLADKRDDGIIQRNIVGQKKRGYLDVDYTTPVLGGTITKW
jgi:hypothetical protein